MCTAFVRESFFSKHGVNVGFQRHYLAPDRDDPHILAAATFTNARERRPQPIDLYRKPISAGAFMSQEPLQAFERIRHCINLMSHLRPPEVA
jgi:hypothetical protein